MAFTYILQCADGSFYVGSTTELSQRLAKHQDGSASAYTAARRPIALVYAEQLVSLTAARERERQLKSWTRAKRAALIGRSQRDLTHLSQSSRTRQRAVGPAPLTEDHPIFRLVGAGRGGGNSPGARDKHAILDK